VTRKPSIKKALRGLAFAVAPAILTILIWDIINADGYIVPTQIARFLLFLMVCIPLAPDGAEWANLKLERPYKVITDYIKQRKERHSTILGRKLKYILAITFIFILIGIVHELLVEYITIGDEQFNKSLTSLVIRNEDLRDEDILQLAYMTNLTSLTLTGNQITDISPLAGLINLTSLDLSDNQISNLSPLEGLTNLTSLALANNQISDILPLAELTYLRRLFLLDNQIFDISPLAELTIIHELNLSYNQISDISPLASLTNLTLLTLSDNQISNLSPLDELMNLGTLALCNNEISNILPLEKLTILSHLSLLGNQINCIAPLAGLINLTGVDLSYNSIYDWSHVEHVQTVWGRP